MSDTAHAETVRTLDQTGDNGREANGRFGKGNQFGPGNPFARRVAQLREAMLEAVGSDDLAAILAKLIEKARAGDVPASKLVLAYAIGKPGTAIDPDTLNHNEWQVWRRSVAPPLEWDAVMTQMPLGFASTMQRFAMPCRVETFGKQYLRLDAKRQERRERAAQRKAAEANGADGGAKANAAEANGADGPPLNTAEIDRLVAEYEANWQRRQQSRAR